MQWFLHHQWIVSIAATWIFNNVVTVLVSSLPAPTKDSSQKYVYWFKVLNTIIGNLQRANSTALEKSPNWQDAIDAHMAKVNGNQPNSQPGAKL
jgi:hypothetical protein